MMPAKWKNKGLTSAADITQNTVNSVYSETRL